MKKGAFAIALIMFGIAGYATYQCQLAQKESKIAVEQAELAHQRIDQLIAKINNESDA